MPTRIPMKFKNTFGAIADDIGIDLQRQDMFKFRIELPKAIQHDWQTDVEWLVEKFPFPSRSVEMTGIKYFQQTNFVIGADAPTEAVDIPVRYAFATRVAQALEKWFWLIRNPITGGVGLTSQVKTKGWFMWYIPNQALANSSVNLQASHGDNAGPVLEPGLIYILEGCLIKGLKPGDADMTGSGKVDLTFSLQMDRYYPENVNESISPTK